MASKRSRAAFESDKDGSSQHTPYALYGTPLPAYDPEAKDDGSFVPVWKQEVTDEQGRKRLHGAFTGGFSAGYFNTVGSKEGWTPATFVSSRANRAKPDGAKQQRPEDFMDDEDRAEQAEAQKLETAEGFAGLGGGEAGRQQRGMFADLFRTTGDTMGVKLLQRMGWRQEQGVGPKIKRRAKGDENGEVHSFAPEDSQMISFDQKTDRKGLGFSGEDRLGIDGGNGAVKDDGDDERDARILQPSRSKLGAKSKLKKKTGIGIGVLNDTGSDDEDPYAMGPQINYSRFIGSDKKKKKGGLVTSTVKPELPKPVFTSRKLNHTATTAQGFRKCHDGRLPLEGFVLSLTPLTMTETNKYPVPEVPAGWTPSKMDASAITSTTYQSTSDAAKASTMDPKSRAILLGEQQLPGKSVFDFISPAVRNRVADASGKSNLPQGLGEDAPAGFQVSEAEKRRTLWDLVPELDKRTAAAALQRGTSGWMPYQEDEEKRARYRYFLELRSGLQANLPDRPKSSTLDDWARELREFAQAAEVFKPISGLMATRFTSSSTTPKLASDAPDTTTTAPEKEDDPAEKAAKLGMYGPLTRSRQPFYPTRLLCKRFNVRPPATASGNPGSATDADAGDFVDANKRLGVVSQASLNRMMQEADWSRVAGNVPIAEGGQSAAAAPQNAGQEPARVDAEKNEALEGQKAGEAVFRDIFGSEDEDD
ncbi:hypothetical protein B0A50_05792 [Salinomyces thailandicus]|uniref:G-patch domain-containing protein n=1 Tax=Salinomyces thailandicus TaxID=706561 RepID=A0A4U0TU49_9PEZI|nr:hypothetical protein B0A50_05792 [Salinomyces thailandica]